MKLVVIKRLGQVWYDVLLYGKS